MAAIFEPLATQVESGKCHKCGELNGVLIDVDVEPTGEKQSLCWGCIDDRTLSTRELFNALRSLVVDPEWSEYPGVRAKSIIATLMMWDGLTDAQRAALHELWPK